MYQIKNNFKNKPTYSLINGNIAFYKRNLSDLGHTFQKRYSRRLHFLYEGGDVALMALSRNSKNRPIRWQNIDTCINQASTLNNLSVTNLIDTQHDPKQLINILSKTDKRVMYLCSPGSAAYTPLLLARVPVIMAVPMRPSIDNNRWLSHLKDFSLFSSKLIVLFNRNSREFESWDSLFKIDKHDFCLLMNIIIGNEGYSQATTTQVENDRMEILSTKCGINIACELWETLKK